MRRLLGVMVAAAGCGDNAQCEPPAELADLPGTGHLIDPYAIPLAGCVDGGLVDLPGRWFVVAPTEAFSFHYPKYEGTCETGFRRALVPEDDHDLTDDGRDRYTWSDGTRVFSRTSFEPLPDPRQSPYVWVDAFVACVRGDGTLAAAYANFNSDDNEETVVAAGGTRFGLRDEPAVGLELVGELGTDLGTPIAAFNLAIDGARAFVAARPGLFVVDIADPAHPAVLGRYDGSFNDVRVVHAGGKTFAIAAEAYATHIIDVTEPARPVLARMLPYSHSVQVVGTDLYLANYTQQVPRYDLTNPLEPVLTGNATVPGQGAVHDLTVDGDRLLVNDTTAGLVAIDVRSYELPVELGRVKSSYSHASAVGTLSSGRRIILTGDEGMTGTPELGAHLTILDGDPSSPTYLETLGTYQSRREVGIHNIELVGDRAYIAYYQDGLRVIDLADPRLPREIAHYNTWNPDTAQGSAFEGALGVRVANGLVYVADDLRGLVILREP
ncbi:MAG: hypothetical protein ABI867_09080 [Kofleriaceae bacterium]